MKATSPYLNRKPRCLVRVLLDRIKRAAQIGERDKTAEYLLANMAH